MENNGFIDIGFSRHKFTCIRGNNESTQKCAKLDRALCNAEWRTQFHEGAVQHLLPHYSDHLPLLVSVPGFAQISCRLKSFRFQVAWTTHEGFERTLRENRRDNTTIVPILQLLLSVLNTWNKEVFGNLFRRKRKTWAHTQGIQRKLKIRGVIATC